MKKSMIITTAILLIATTALTACGGNTAATTPAPKAVQSSTAPIPSSSTPTSVASTDIGVDKAKEIALQHAGLSASEVTFVKEKLEMDDGLREYDIDFVNATTKYDYEINSTDGTVVQFSQESIIQTSPNLTANSAIAGDIGIEKAKEIALEAAGFSASDVTFIKIKLDNDDGVPEYEIDFVANKLEHDYSIHAISGDIIEFNVEKN